MLTSKKPAYCVESSSDFIHYRKNIRDINEFNLYKLIDFIYFLIKNFFLIFLHYSCQAFVETSYVICFTTLNQSKRNSNLTITKFLNLFRLIFTWKKQHENLSQTRLMATPLFTPLLENFKLKS